MEDISLKIIVFFRIMMRRAIALSGADTVFVMAPEMEDRIANLPRGLDAIYKSDLDSR